jgi:hypothetical protein
MTGTKHPLSNPTTEGSSAEGVKIIIHFPCTLKWLDSLLTLGFDPVLVSWAAESFSLFVAVEEHVTWIRSKNKRKSRHQKSLSSSHKVRQMNLTLVLDELAPVVAFPERAECGLIRECVVLADERLQVLSRLWAVVCRVTGSINPFWIPASGSKKTGGG